LLSGLSSLLFREELFAITGDNVRCHAKFQRRNRPKLSLDRQPNGCVLESARKISMDAVFRALADASRRELLDRLRADNGQTLNELCRRLAMTRQAVSKHLGILEEANLIATVKRGREKLHYLNPVPIHEIAERWIGRFERHRLQALSELKRGLERES
jgi:DNA-binding transcriptional ArsR family regulator